MLKIRLSWQSQPCESSSCFFPIVASPIFEIGSGDREIDYKAIHSPARPNGDDGRVAIRSLVDAAGALRSCWSIARAIFGHQRGVIDERKNEFVFNGNAGFPRLSLLWCNS
jgi:hypothetical protein